jgi:thioester reductase-like protein
LLQLQTSLTLIIHNAWRLDFNLSLSSFEPHVRGVRNLIDLARSSRYASSLRFLFTSSIGTALSWDSRSLGPYPEEVVMDPRYAVGNGYGESKYVSERVIGPSYLARVTLQNQCRFSQRAGCMHLLSELVKLQVENRAALGP